jgi:hypothetical protein
MLWVILILMMILYVVAGIAYLGAAVADDDGIKAVCIIGAVGSTIVGSVLNFILLASLISKVG